MNYYSLDRIIAQKANYNILVGMRANGKSYSVKRECVKEAFLGMGDLIYLRRYDLELKEEDVKDYFRDCPTSEITGGQFNFIDVYRGRIYLANIDEDLNVKRDRCIGRTAALSRAGKLKSVIQRGQYKNIIYEEFCTNEGFLRNEPSILQQFVATCFGVQYTGRVYLIGNTVSKYNPYFYQWNLKNLQKMKPGDLDLYLFKDGDDTIKIAVEFCAAVESKNTMFFGNDKANITTGVWETQAQPQVPDDFGGFKVRYRVMIEHEDFKFMLKVIQNKARELLLLCVPAEEETARRIVSDQITGDPYRTTRLLPLTNGDGLVIDLIKRGKLVYANNMTGTDFKAVLKSGCIL